MLQKFGATNFKPNDYKKKNQMAIIYLFFLATFSKWIM
jgi:hypothetical protein